MKCVSLFAGFDDDAYMILFSSCVFYGLVWLWRNSIVACRYCFWFCF